MKIKFMLYAGTKEYIKIVEFADGTPLDEIEQAFYDWKAGLFYALWEICDD